MRIEKERVGPTVRMCGRLARPSNSCYRSGISALRREEWTPCRLKPKSRNSTMMIRSTFHLLKKKKTNRFQQPDQTAANPHWPQDRVWVRIPPPHTEPVSGALELTKEMTSVITNPIGTTQNLMNLWHDDLLTFQPQSNDLPTLI
uniref:Uncharacterized protein n=1 Tax=Ciona savignyi TaxID=51511 RepID=H2Z8L4_CIOSA